MRVRAGAMLTEVFLKNFDDIPSGPEASYGSNYCNSLSIYTFKSCSWCGVGICENGLKLIIQDGSFTKAISNYVVVFL